MATQIKTKVTQNKSNSATVVKQPVLESQVLEQPVLETVEQPVQQPLLKNTDSKESRKPKMVDKLYRLTDNASGASYILKTGRNKKLTIFDEELGYRRAIRHCPNETSIFLEEQSKHAVVEAITFEKGEIEVLASEQITQQFLDAHPSNTANGGSVFELVDYAKEADEIVDMQEIVSSITEAIRQKGNEEDGIYALEMVASVLEGSLESVANMKLAELKRVIYFHVENDPHYFINADTKEVNIFDDLDMQRRYVTLKALREQVIKKSMNGRSMLWYKGGKEIISAPYGVDIIDHFSKFLETNDGILVLSEIEKRLN